MHWGPGSIPRKPLYLEKPGPSPCARGDFRTTWRRPEAEPGELLPLRTPRRPEVSFRSAVPGGCGGRSSESSGWWMLPPSGQVRGAMGMGLGLGNPPAAWLGSACPAFTCQSPRAPPARVWLGLSRRGSRSGGRGLALRGVAGCGPILIPREGPGGGAGSTRRCRPLKICGREPAPHGPSRLLGLGA